jgi:type VI secretion system protein VasD
MKCLTIPVRNFLICILVSLVAGCGTVKPLFECEEPAFTLNIKVATDINPAQDGRASPVILNVFALEGERQFEQEEFIALYQDPDAVLGRDLLSAVKLRELIPGELRTEKLVFDKRTRFVGIMAEYIRYDDADTKLVIPRKECKSSVDLFVDRLSMRFEQ